MLTALAVGGAQAGPPSPSSSNGADIWGQSDRTAEVSGRPLEKTIALFRSNRFAAQLPTPNFPGVPLAEVAKSLRGNPGALITSETKRFRTGAGAIYFVPTTRGWIRMQAQHFASCHRGLLRQGIAWDICSTPTGLDVVGIAANNVAAVALTYGTHTRRATLTHNIFFVHRPPTFTSTQHLPPLGNLTISYRGTKQQETAALN